jgi:hypothetical protein
MSHGIKGQWTLAGLDPACYGVGQFSNVWYFKSNPTA